MKDYKRNKNRERRSEGSFGTEKREFSREFKRSGTRNEFRSDRQRKRFSKDFERPEKFRRGPESPREQRSSRSEMHQIICDQCGKESTVPFKPTSNKPLYCSDCFRNKGSSPKREFQTQQRPGVSSEDLAKINQKLDKILEALKIQ